MENQNSLTDEERSAEIYGSGHRDAGSVFLESVTFEIPAARYFQALEGPELEVLRDREKLGLPPVDKKWPFLLRFPNAFFGMCIGLASQASLWKALSTSPAVNFLHIPPQINLALWLLAVCILILVFCTYFLKIIYHFEAVKREFCHPVRVNFFFAPWVACMTLTIAVPPAIAESVHPSLWCIFMAPLLILELKIYGQWLSGGEKRLSTVANPSTHLSVVGNFVGSLLAARLGWMEPAKFLWAVGLAHYLVLFVTLYQRLPTSETLPKELHPVFFLFLAAPATASWAWETIFGEFDTVSRIMYFVSLFIYTSLVVRVKLFRGFRFSISWWAYTYPMTSTSIATIRYSEQVPHLSTHVLAVLLSTIASVTVFSLFVTTLLHAFVWKTLFPNDMAIAITTKQRNNMINSSPNLKFKFYDSERTNTKPKGRVRNSFELLKATIRNHGQRRETPVCPDNILVDDQGHADEVQMVGNNG